MKNAKNAKKTKIIRKSPNHVTIAKTPNSGDRFISSRSTSNFDVSRYKILQQQNTRWNGDRSDNISPSKREMQRLMRENLLRVSGDINNMGVLSYQVKASAPSDGYQNYLKTLYGQTKTLANIKAIRYISKKCDRTLAAPEVINNYYSNLVDWSSNNILAVALDTDVYLWNAGTETSEPLFGLDENNYICSVAWIQKGSYLAVGTTLGEVELWDCSKLQRIRVMNGHVTRVGSLSWNSHILSSGCSSGKIVHHDVRQNHMISTINAHNKEICGLKWSPNGRYLASGGNNVVQIWSLIAGRNYFQTQPIYCFNHQAAVKALAWCPWQNNILASGGDAADRTIKFWNCNTGACLNAVDTKSQVCALLWSRHYKEIISGHGFPQNQLTIWKYPTMTKTAELTGHTDRVLNLAMSPDETTVLSVSADETLKLWKCFEMDKNKRKECSEVKSIASKLKLGSIR